MEVVDHATPLEALAEVFSRANVAVVLKDEDVSGIVTKTDLIDFLASGVK
jgi:predicted transcriptional regulator